MTATITLDTTEAVPALVVSGPGEAPDYVRLVGARAGVEADPVADGSGWSARLPLHRSRWGGAELPLPGGEYRLEVAGHEAAGSVPMTIEGTLRVAVDGGSVEIGPPLDPSVEDPEGRAALERRYTLHSAPLENAVFFESFYGRVAGDNPLAIDREIARIAPGVTRYWSVIDLSVEVPEGAIAVVEGSSDWWRARSASRLLIVNDWLRRRYARRPGQKVLQTWHGTPLKRLALTRPGFRRSRNHAAGTFCSRRIRTPPGSSRAPTRSEAARCGWRGTRATMSCRRETAGAPAVSSGSATTRRCCSTRPPGATTAARWSISWTRRSSPSGPERSCWSAGTVGPCCPGRARRVRE
jgi:hypothetical protein